MNTDPAPMMVALIEPQLCFTPALAGIFAAHAPHVGVRAFGSFEAAAAAIPEADVVVVDVDPGALDLASASAAVAAYGGRATIVMTSRRLADGHGAPPAGLLGIVSKSAEPVEFVDAVVRAARMRTAVR